MAEVHFINGMLLVGTKEEIDEATREEAEKKRLAKDNPDDYAVRNIGHGKWSTKRKSSMKGQAKRRGEGLKNVDTDLPSKSKEKGEAKTKKIVGRGKEHHHLTPISQSTKEFKGLSPEQRKAKREKDAKQHKYHGSAPRNLAQAEGPKGGKGIPHRGEGGYHSKQKAVGSGGEGKDFGSEAQILAVKRRKASRERRQNEEFVYEVSPPGWGHTKAEKEKTKPWKPKSKIGGSAAEFKKDLDSGKFKGLPGDKTKKEKTASMFKLMWSMKKKGYKPHYKPGTDKKYKKYQKNDYVPAGQGINETSMPHVDPKDKKVIRDRAKTLFKKDLKGDVRGVNEGISFKKYYDTAKKAISKKQEMPQPKRADDAGARARRLMKRKEHQAKVSVIVPPELED